MLILISGNQIISQSFTCDGSLYSVFSPLVTNSRAYIIRFGSGQDSVTFDPLPSETGVYINAIGYRRTDNYIYGINPPTQDLYRIESHGFATFLSSLTGLNPNHEYISGEVTPDGEYLLLQGGNGGNLGIEDTEIVYVNLDPPHATNRVPVQTVSGVGLRCADIAFDPHTEILYGYDGLAGRLVIIDHTTGFIDDTVYPAYGTARVMASLFFDAFGNLFGYGQPSDSTALNTFYRIDKNTGQIFEIAKGPVADRNDGCTCPYGIELQKSVAPKEVIPCSEVTYTFKISNASSAVQENIQFSDMFPPGFTILEVSPSAYADISAGVGTNLLSIDDLDIAPGIDSFTVRVEVGEIDAGTYYNQAVLTDLSFAFGFDVYSDDPATDFFEDSTALRVLALSLDISNQVLAVCPGDSAILDATNPGNPDYEWSTGSTKPAITITEGGTYWVKLTSECEELIDTAIIIDADGIPLVDLGEGQEIFLGEQIELSADVEGMGIYDYEWSADQSTEITCTDCPNPVVGPFRTTTYLLEVTDEFGCVGSDLITITVDVEERVYVPNVFSPNRDEVNDIFYVQGIEGTIIRSLNVFSRSGELIFSIENVPVNEISQGWNGTFRGQDLNPGVFGWVAEIEFFDSSTTVLAGNVTLIR